MSSDSGSRLSVSWKTVAISSVLLNAGATAAVAAISSSNGADALTATALALAVIAFICQLIIFAVQTSHSSNQLRQAQELNASTLGLMTEVKGRVQNAEHLIQSQHDHLLGLARETSADKAFSTIGQLITGDGDAKRADEVVAQLRHLFPTEQREDIVVAAPSQPPERDAAHPSLSWPQDVSDLVTYVEELEKLNPLALDLFAHDLGYDISTNLRGIPLILHEEEMPLVEHGLIEEADPTWDDLVDEWEKRGRLTDRGRKVGSVLAAALPPPVGGSALTERIARMRASLTKRARRGLERASGA